MMQERIKENVLLITIPFQFDDENRGYFECCEPELVMASTSSTDSWKNDIFPDWMKLFSSSDTVSWKLKKGGVDALWQPVVKSFPNDLYSKYVEVIWRDVLAMDGAGCYTLEKDYEISGIEGSEILGKFELKPYSIDGALGTARLRAVFNHFQELDGINFRGANVRGTMRFGGYIGNRQPNKEIDNLVYQNRIIHSVVRENIPTWEMKTDPLHEKYTTRLTDLYLLSETELYISDYNSFNHSYKIFDIPVTLQESEELEYKEFNRGANVNATFTTRVRNKRTYYK